MRSMPAVLLAVASVVAGACSSPAGDLATGSTPTTGADGTTTTAPDGPRPAPGADEDPCTDPPVWAWKAQAPGHDCETPPTTDVEPTPRPEPEPDLGTGDVQITLRWTTSADLDLHVVEPSGTEIAYTNPGPTATGGTLDVDSNIGCALESSVENVYWPEGDMPLGSYRVEVHGYEVEGCGGGDYTLTATVKGRPVLVESGSVLEDETDRFGFVAA